MGLYIEDAGRETGLPVSPIINYPVITDHIMGDTGST